MVVGAMTVFFKQQITPGQALVFAFGGALIAIPQIANFEIENGALKFTTRDQSAMLPTQVDNLNKEQAELAITVLALTQQNQALSEQVAKLSENASRADDGDTTTIIPQFVPRDWSTVQQNTQSLIKQSEGRTLQLDNLKQELELK